MAAIGALVLVAAAIAGWVQVPELYTGVGDEAARVQAIVTTRASVLAALAGLGALVTIGINYRNSRTNAETLRTTQETFRVTERGHLTQRYTAAIEQLGDADSVAIRLGGIYALEQLAADSPRPGDQTTVVEVLSAFARLPRTSTPDALKDSRATSQVPGPWIAPTPRRRRVARGLHHPETNTAPVGWPVLPADVQAAVSVLGRLPSTANVPRADLTRADLTGADLTNANLTGARLFSAKFTGSDFTGAALSGADLTDADLTDADLTDADLTNANLLGAGLTGVCFIRTDLAGTRLGGTRLAGARLIRGRLAGADLYCADLTGARLASADLAGADLAGAKLAGADLTGANLTRANLFNADLTDADLTDADLTDANLTDANLTDADFGEVVRLSREQLGSVQWQPDGSPGIPESGGAEE